MSQLETTGNRIIGIQLKDGRHFDVESVALISDVVHVYNYLLRYHPTANKRAGALKRKRMSNSLFMLDFGLNLSHS